MAGEVMALRIAAAAGNTTLLPQGSVIVGGSGPDRTLTLTPDPDQFGSSPVTVSVTDASGKDASVTFMLTVKPVYASFTQSTDTAFNTDPDGKPVPVSGVTFVPDADSNADAFATFLRSRDAICVARLLAALLGTIVTVSAPAAPWRPSDDAAILVQVPPRNPMSPLAIAERDCAANPADGPTVARLVQALTDLGRRAADPRYFGRAEAVLLRYRSNHALSPELALASADILQHRHDYVAARKVLDNLLHDAPNALQPRLMRAQMNLAQGRFDEARSDCLALLRSSALGSGGSAVRADT